MISDLLIIFCFACFFTVGYAVGKRNAISDKVNEWHYPSKNELPNCDDKTLLIFIANDYSELNGETIIKKRTVLGFYKKAFINDNMKLFVEKSKGHEEEYLPQAVIAWKEIIPSKEI